MKATYAKFLSDMHSNSTALQYIFQRIEEAAKNGKTDFTFRQGSKDYRINPFDMEKLGELGYEIQDLSKGREQIVRISWNNAEIPFWEG